MASYVDEKLLKLIDRLLYGTKSNQINWEETDRKQAYVYSTKAYSVVISSVDNDGSVPFELRIIDGRGSVIDSIVSHWATEDESYRVNTGAAEKLERLHAMVRRQVLGVDKAIDELIESLPDPWEEPPF